MQSLDQRAKTHLLVNGQRSEPDRLSLWSLVISVESTAYSDAVETVRVHVRWSVTGDYSVHDVEPSESLSPAFGRERGRSVIARQQSSCILVTALDRITERVKILHDESDQSA